MYIRLCKLERENWLNYLQTVKTLIRRRMLRHLIWVFIVCQLPFKESPEYNGLMLTFFKKYFGNTIRVSNSLDPDQARCFVKLLAKVISRRQKSSLARKELSQCSSIDSIKLSLLFSFTWCVHCFCKKKYSITLQPQNILYISPSKNI